MKRFLQIFIVAVISCCIGASCEKDNIGRKPKVGSMEDLLGTYSVTVEENISWGGDSGTLYDSGTITVTQISQNRVRLRGLISTQGELVDGKLYLDPETNSDSYGYLTTTYWSVIFGSGTLTIFTRTSGQLSTTPNGTRYSFSSLCHFKGTKVNQYID